MEVDTRQKKIELAKKKLNRFRSSNASNPNSNSNGESHCVPPNEHTVFHGGDNIPLHFENGPELLTNDLQNGTRSSTNALTKLKHTLGYLQQSIDGVLHTAVPLGSDESPAQITSVHHLLDTLEKYASNSGVCGNVENFLISDTSPCDKEFVFPSGFEQIDHVQSLLATKDATIRDLGLQIQHLQDANHSLHLDHSRQEELLCQEVNLLMEKLSSAKTTLQTLNQTNADLASREQHLQVTFHQKQELLHQTIEQITKEKEAVEKELQERISSLEHLHSKELTERQVVEQQLRDELQRVVLTKEKEQGDLLMQLSRKDAALDRLNQTLAEKEQSLASLLAAHEAQLSQLKANCELQKETLHELELRNQQLELEKEILQLEQSQLPSCSYEWKMDAECQCNMLLDASHDIDMFQAQVEQLRQLSEHLQAERDHTNVKLASILSKLKNRDEGGNVENRRYLADSKPADCSTAVSPSSSLANPPLLSSSDGQTPEPLSTIEMSKDLTELVYSNLYEMEQLKLERSKLSRELNESQVDISALQKLINQLHAKHTQFQEEIDSLRNEIAEYERRIQSLNELVETLQSQLLDAHLSADTALSLRVAVEEEKDQLTKTNHELSERISHLLESLENERQLNATLQEECNSHQAEAQGGKKVIQDQAYELEKLTSENVSLRGDLNQLQSEIRHTQDVIEKQMLEQMHLRDQVEHVNEERDSLFHHLQDIINSCDPHELCHEDDCMKAHDLISTLRRLLSHMQKEKSQLADVVECKVQDIDALSQEIRSLNQQMNHLQTKLSAASEESHSLQATLEEVRREKEECDSAYQLLKLKYETTHSKYQCTLMTALENQEVTTATQAEVFHLKRSLAEASQESFHFDSRFQHLLEELASSNVALSKLVAEREELQRQQAKRSDEVKRECHKEITELRKELHRLQNEHSDCLNRENMQLLSKFGFGCQEAPLLPSLLSHMEMEFNLRQNQLDKIEELLTSTSILRAQLDVAEERRLQLAGTVEHLSTLHSMDVASLHVKDEHIATLEEQCATKAKDYEDILTKFFQNQEENEKLVSEMHVLAKDNQVLHEQIAQLAQENQSYQDDVTALRSTIEDLTLSKDMLQQQNGELVSELDILSEDNKDLHEQVKHLTQENQSHKDDAAALRSTLEDLSLIKEELQQALDASTTTASDYKKSLEDRISNYSCLEEAVNDLFEALKTAVPQSTESAQLSNSNLHNNEPGFSLKHLQSVKENMLALIVKESQLSEKIKLLESQIEESISVISEKDAIIDGLNRRIALNENFMETCNADICSLQAEVQSLQEAMRVTTEQCVANTEVNHRLNADLLTALRHVDAMEFSFVCMNVVDSQLREEVQSLKALNEGASLEANKKESELMQQIQQLKSTLEDKLSTISTLQSTEQELLRQLEHFNEKLKLCHEEVNHLQNEKVNLMNEISTMKEDILKLTLKETQLLETVHLQESSLTTKQSDYDALKEQFDRSVEHLHTTSAELASFQREFFNVHKEGEKNFSELCRLHDEKQCLNEELGSVKERYHILEKHYEQMKVSETLRLSQLEEKEKDLDKLNRCFKEKEEEYLLLQQQVVHLEAKLFTKTLEGNHSKEEISRLTSELGSAKSTMEHLREQLEDLTVWESRMLMELSEAKEKIYRSKVKIASLRECLSQKDSTLCSQTMEISQLRGELQQLGETVATINSHLANYTNEIHTLREMMSETQSTEQAYERQLSEHVTREIQLDQQLKCTQLELTQERSLRAEQEQQLNVLQEELLQKQNILETYNSQLTTLQNDLSHMNSHLLEIHVSLQERECLLVSMNESLAQKDKQIDALVKEKIVRDSEDFSMETDLQHLQSVLQKAVTTLSSLLENKQVELPDLSPLDAQLIAIVDSLVESEGEEASSHECLLNAIQTVTGGKPDSQRNIQIVEIAADLLQSQATRLMELTSFIQWCSETFIGTGLHSEPKDSLSVPSLSILQKIIEQLIDQAAQKSLDQKSLNCPQRCQSLPALGLCEDLSQFFCDHDRVNEVDLAVNSIKVDICDPSSVDEDNSADLAAFLNAWEQALDALELNENKDPLEEEIKRRTHVGDELTPVPSSGTEGLGQFTDTNCSLPNALKELLEHLQQFSILPHSADSFDVEHLPHLQKSLKLLQKIVAHAECDPLVGSLSKVVIHYITEKMDDAGEKVDLFHWITDSTDPLWPHLHEFLTRIQEECSRFLPIHVDSNESVEIGDISQVSSTHPLIAILCRNIDLAVSALCALKQRIVQRQAVAHQSTSEQEKKLFAEDQTLAIHNGTPEGELWAEICSTTDIQDLQEFCFVMTKGNEELQRQLRASSDMNAELLKHMGHVSQQIYRVNELVDQATHSMVTLEMNLPRDISFYPSGSKSQSRKMMDFQQDNDMEKGHSGQSRMHRSNPSFSRTNGSAMDDSALGDINYVDSEGNPSCLLPMSMPRQRHSSENSYLDSRAKFQSTLKISNGDQTLSSLSSIIIDSKQKDGEDRQQRSQECDSGVNTTLITQMPFSRCASSCTPPTTSLPFHSSRNLESPQRGDVNLPNLMSAIEQHRSAVLQLRSLIRDLNCEACE